MTPACQRTVTLLGQPTPPEVAEHIRGCAECQAVVQGYEALGRLPRQAVPPALEKTRAAALKALAEQPRPGAWWRPLGILLLLELAAAGAGMWGLSTRGAEATLSMSVALVLTAVMAVGAFAAMRRSPTHTRQAVLPYAVLVVLTLGIGLLLPASPTPQNCLGTEVLLSLVPMGAAVYLLAGTAFRPWTTLLATLSAGVAGLVALSIHCSDWSWHHLAAFHLAPWLALAGMAVWIRSRIPSRTFAP